MTNKCSTKKEKYYYHLREHIFGWLGWRLSLYKTNPDCIEFLARDRRGIVAPVEFVCSCSYKLHGKEDALSQIQDWIERYGEIHPVTWKDGALF